jgi:hypothetical protein
MPTNDSNNVVSILIAGRLNRFSGSGSKKFSRKSTEPPPSQSSARTKRNQSKKELLHACERRS